MCRSLSILFLPSHKSSSIDYLLWLIQYHTMGLWSQFSFDSLNQPSNIANMLLLNLKFRIEIAFLFFFHAQMSTYMHRTNITICFKSNKNSSDNHVCGFVSIHVGGYHVDGIPLSVVDTVSSLIWKGKTKFMRGNWNWTYFFLQASRNRIRWCLLNQKRWQWWRNYHRNK